MKYRAHTHKHTDIEIAVERYYVDKIAGKAQRNDEKNNICLST